MDAFVPSNEIVGGTQKWENYPYGVRRHVIEDLARHIFEAKEKVHF